MIGLSTFRAGDSTFARRFFCVPTDVPINPPAEWFTPPSDIPTDKRIAIEPSGRVYGYVALWDTCHAGLGGCTQPPKGSPTNYEYAHQGETLTAEGDLIRTAVIAGGIGHSPVDTETLLVPEYYENTGRQLMRVRYGEDENGLWFAGSLWPDVQELDVARIRASAISGDWRWHAAWRHTASGGYDFAGSCFVNIPGFPMPTADNSIGGRAGQMRSLAASLGTGWIVSDGSDWINTDQDTNMNAEGPEMCDGGCACDKSDEVEVTEDQLVDQLVATMGQIVDRRKRKKAIYADAAPNESDELRGVVEGLVARLDALEAQDIARQLIETD